MNVMDFEFIINQTAEEAGHSREDLDGFQANCCSFGHFSSKYGEFAFLDENERIELLKKKVLNYLD